MLNKVGGRRGRPKRATGAAPIDAQELQLNGHGGQLHQLAGAIQQNQRRIAEATIATGRALLLARRLLDPADFRRWLAETHDWSESSAESLMLVAERFGGGDVGEAVERIAPGALYILAPPAADRAAKAAVTMARRGRYITYAAAAELLARYCPDAVGEAGR